MGGCVLVGGLIGPRRGAVSAVAAGGLRGGGRQHGWRNGALVVLVPNQAVHRDQADRSGDDDEPPPQLVAVGHRHTVTVAGAPDERPSLRLRGARAGPGSGSRATRWAP